MKVVGFDRKQYNLSLNKKARNKVSSYHERARVVLNKIFKNDTVYEEICLPGSKKNNGSNLFCDFLIPSHRIIVEVQGQQHLSETRFFHDTKLDFLASRRRDRTKEEWSQLNGFIFIELLHNQSDEEWEKNILLSLAE